MPKSMKQFVPRFSINDPLPRKAPYDPYKFARCRHHRYSLRGCWLPKDHEGPHFNPHALDNETWTDSDGMFIKTQEDWSSLIDQLGKTKH
jgi:hypothetical protein